TERRVHLGRRREPEGRPRLCERLQQRPLDRSRRSEAGCGAMMRLAWRVLVVAAAACAHGHRSSTADAGLRTADLNRPAGSGPQSAVRSPQSGVPDQDYLLFVASEGNDRIALIRFGPAGAKVDRDHRMSLNPAELP